jgi:hypothetical protein
MKLSVQPGRNPLRTAALASVLLIGGGASAAPLLQASPDPASIGSVFSIDWTDSATNPATGFTGFDVLVGFDASTLKFMSGLAGSAFGNPTTSVTFDIDGDSNDDPGWAQLHVARAAGAQPTSFGSDIFRFDVLVRDRSSTGRSTDVSFYPSLSIGAPGAGDYVVFGPGRVDSLTTTVGIAAAVPEPASLALTLAGLGLLTMRARRRSSPAARPVATVS